MRKIIKYIASTGYLNAGLVHVQSGSTSETIKAPNNMSPEW